jgi:hypothetical protein
LLSRFNRKGWPRAQCLAADSAPCAHTAEDPNPTSEIAATKARRDMDSIETRNLLPPVLLVQRASAAVASCGIGRNPELKVSFYLAGTGNDTPAASSDMGLDLPVWQHPAHGRSTSESGRKRQSACTEQRCLVSRASPVHTALRNCTGDEGGPFGFGDQVADPKPARAAVVKSHGRERRGNVGTMIPAGKVERGERK